MGDPTAIRRMAADLLKAAGGDPLRAIGLAWLKQFWASTEPTTPIREERDLTRKEPRP